MSLRFLLTAILAAASTMLVSVSAQAQVAFLQTDVFRDDPMSGIRRIASVESAGNHFLVGSSDTNDGLSVFQVGTDGSLTYVSAFHHSDAIDLTIVGDLVGTDIAGNGFVYVSLNSDQGIGVFSISASGTLQLVEIVGDAGGQAISMFSRAEIIPLGGTPHLVASLDRQRIGIFSIGSDGRLTFVGDTNNDGSGNFQEIYGIAAFNLEGTDYLAVTDGRLHTVNILAVDPGFSLRLADSVSDTADHRFRETDAVAFGQQNGVNFLFVSGASDSGLSVFTVATDGSLSHLADWIDDRTIALHGAVDLSTFNVGNQLYLISTASSDSGISVSEVGMDGTLTSLSTVYNNDAPDYALLRVSDLEILEMDSERYLFSVSPSDNGVSSFLLSDAFEISNVNSVFGTNAETLDGVRAIEIVEQNGTHYAYVMSHRSGMLNVFTVDSDGLLNKISAVPVAEVDRSAVSVALSSYETDGTTFLILAADGQLIVYEIIAEGGLIERSRAASETFGPYFAGVSTIRIERFGETDYVFAAARGRDSVTVMSIDNQGQLTYESSFRDRSILQNVSTLDIARVDGSAFLLTGGSGGVSVFALSENAELSFLYRIAHTFELPLREILGSRVEVIGDQTYWYLSDVTANALTAFRVDASGQLTLTDQIRYSEQIPLNGMLAIDSFEYSNTVFLTVSSAGGRVWIFTATSDGSLNYTAEFGDEYLLANAYDFAFATIDNKQIVLVGGDSSETLVAHEFYALGARLESITRANPTQERTQADELVFDIRFTEPVQNVDVSGFDITSMHENNREYFVLEGSGANYTLTMSPPTLVNASGPIGISVNRSHDMRDMNGVHIGYLNPPINERFIIDNQAPSFVWMRTDDFANIESDFIEWELRISEPVLNLDLSDFTFIGPGNLTWSNVQLNWIDERDFTISANFQSTGYAPAWVRLGTAEDNDVIDLAGNGNDVNGRLTGTINADNRPRVDTVRPQVVFYGPEGIVNEPFIAFLVFSEGVEPFPIDAIVATNATISDLNQDSSDIYSFVVAYENDGPITLDFAANVTTDFVGNPSTAAPTYTVTADGDAVLLAVRKSGLGGGTITSDPQGVNCEPTCLVVAPRGLEVTLTATATTDSTFAGWVDGPCAGSTQPDCRVVMSDHTDVDARFTLNSLGDARVVGAVLPGARSAQLNGTPASAFMSLAAASTRADAQNCTITVAPGPASLTYRQVDEFNVAYGRENPVFDIAHGEFESFVLSLTPVATTGDEGFMVFPQVECQNTRMDPVEGVNSIQLTIGENAGPDVIAIGATPSGDGILRIPAGRAAAFGVAALNIGTGDGSTANADEATITASLDTGTNTALPVHLDLCPTDPATGTCQSPRAAQHSVVMETNRSQTFSVFARDESDGGIALDPANARVFVRFADANGVVRSVTSVAITAPASELAERIAPQIAGRWSVLLRNSRPESLPLARSSVFVSETGRAIIDDGVSPRAVRFHVQNDAGRIALEAAGDGTQEGIVSRDNAIRLGSVLAQEDGVFWGARDRRNTTYQDWQDSAGRYGGLELSVNGRVHGRLAGCDVSGQASPGAIIELVLSGCEIAGSYLAALDLPVSMSGPAALLIASESRGWRLARDQDF